MDISPATYDNLSIEVSDGVATVTLDRPEVLNAFNMALKNELASAINFLSGDPLTRCVVITGAGKGFSAGTDIGEMGLNDSPVSSRQRLQTLLREVYIPLAEMEKPTIASVNGYAFGSGLSLAMACDMIIASRDASMSCAFTSMGLLPDCGSLYFLPRRLPMNLAKDLIFTGRRISADEALEMNLINKVVAAEELAGVSQELARRLAAGPTLAYGISKRLLDRSLETPLHEMAMLEEFGQAVLLSTDDHVAARDAFVNKSRATFQGH